VEQVFSFGGAWFGTLEALYAVHIGHSQTILGINLLTSVAVSLATPVS
jgi:hypothetical protein